MDVTADFLLKVLIEANLEKVERVITKAALQEVGEGEYILENEKGGLGESDVQHNVYVECPNFKFLKLKD